MATDDQTIEIGQFRLDREGEYGWFPFCNKGTPVKFKTTNDAIITRRRLGWPIDKFRIIDLNKGRKVYPR